MKTKVVIAAAMVTGMAMVVGPILLALVAVLVGAGASAGANPCSTLSGPPVSVDPSAGAELLPPVGGTILPLAGGSWSSAGNGPITTQPVIDTFPAQVLVYRGEQLVNAAYIIKAGQVMGLGAQSITIGVMTAMGESGLINVGYGDVAGPDSRGLFQQRANGVWGSLAERMNPTAAASSFFRMLVSVPGYLSLEPTIAAHRTQRNADPYHYRPYWAGAVQIVASLTADPALLEQLPAAGPIMGCGALAGPLVDGDGSSAGIVTAAEHYLGTLYSWGGGDITGPTLGINQSASLDGSRTVGFDCSGLVIFAVYHATGVRLSHSAEAQGQDPRGQTIARDLSAMAPGDVISFSEDGSGAPGSFGHVGIYLGEGKMIHAPRPGRSVEIVQLAGVRYWESMAWAIKRYTSSTAPTPPSTA